MIFSGDPNILKFADIYANRFREALGEFGLGSYLYGVDDKSCSNISLLQDYNFTRQNRLQQHWSNPITPFSRFGGRQVVLPFLKRDQQPPIEFRLPSSLELSIWPTPTAPNADSKDPDAPILSPEKRGAEANLESEPDVKKAKPIDECGAGDAVVVDDPVIGKR